MFLQYFFSILLLLSGMGPPPPADEGGTELLLFQGRVIKLGPHPVYKNGGDLAYRLVKYKVERVCEGEYSGSEIVVDHYLRTGRELRGVKVGDVVCVTVEKRRNISMRENAAGIREPSEIVNVFYHAQGLTRHSCKCSLDQSVR